MRIAIVGGSGKMGQWFARLLRGEGNEVLVVGRSEEKLRHVRSDLDIETTTDISRVGDADVVIVTVPLDAFELVIGQVAPHVNSAQVVVDFTSLKAKPVDIMHTYIGAAVTLGTHPVFGPGAKSLANQNFVLTPTNEREYALALRVKEYLETHKARVSLMSPEEHDRMMTVILGLAHFIAIASADTLLSMDRFQEMKQIGGTTFRVLYTLVESVLSEDPELYASLQMGFPDISIIEGQFRQSVETWANIVKNNDRQTFVDRMTALKDRLEETDPDFRTAYEDMYRITDGLS